MILRRTTSHIKMLYLGGCLIRRRVFFVARAGIVLSWALTHPSIPKSLTEINCTKYTFKHVIICQL